MGPPSPAPPRSAAALLVDRRFGPWFWGQLVSNAGNWLYNVTAAVVVFRLTGSALLVGLVSAAQLGVLAVASPWTGALSDRFDRRRLLLAGQGFAALAASVIAAVSLSEGVDRLPGAWPVLVATLGIGVGKALAEPAASSFFPSLVGNEDLPTAVSLNSLTFQVGRALGPATAGVLLATLGAEAAFAVNAVTYIAFLAAVLALQGQAPSRRLGGDRSVRAGLRYVRGNRVLLLALTGVAAAGFASDPTVTLAPSLSDVLGGGETTVTAFVSAFGVAAALAALLSGRLQRALGSSVVAAGGMLAMATGLSIAALAPVVGVVIAGFLVTGAGMTLAVTSFTTVLQRRLDDALRGRVMALWGVGFLGTRPVAAVVDGAAADLAGPRLAMIIGIAVALAGVRLARNLQRESSRQRSP